MEFLVQMEVVLDFDSKESFLINKDEKKQMNMKEKKNKDKDGEMNQEEKRDEDPREWISQRVEDKALSGYQNI